MGGLPRRATVIAELRQAPESATSPLFVVDGGNFAWKGGRIREPQVPQQRRKAELILDAFAHDGVQAVAPGASDLVLGVDWLREAAASRKVPLTLANLTCHGEAPFPSHLIVEEGGIKLGVIGVLGKGRLVDGCEVGPAVEALRQEAAALQDVDLLLVVSHSSDEEDEALAREVPAVDLILNGHARLTRETPRTLPEGALQLSVGSRGKKQGVATITLQPGAHGFSVEEAAEDVAKRRDTYLRRLETAQRNQTSEDPAARRRAEGQVTFYTEELAKLDAELARLQAQGSAPAHQITNRLVDLDTKVADNKAVLALVEAANADIARIETEVGAVEVPPLTDTPFLGSAACAGCHPGPYAQWLETGHARAYASLEVEEREMDRECYTCHVTGAFHASGPQHPSQVGLSLRGVGCESCHGPGREHVSSAAQVDMVASPAAETCTQCHDGVRDEGRFELETYLQKVRHAP